MYGWIWIDFIKFIDLSFCFVCQYGTIKHNNQTSVGDYLILKRGGKVDEYE